MVVVMDDVMMVMVCMGLLWGYGSALLLQSMSLVLLLLHEVKWVIPITSQTLPLPLFALGLAFSLPLTFFAVCPSLQVLCRLGSVHQQG